MIELKHNVWAVIVTYHPSPAQLQHALRSVVQQVDRIVVVDNGSPSSPREVAPIELKDPRVMLIEHGKNLGLARGHNTGIDAARAGGASHVLLLDQDSVPRPDMVSRLLIAIDGLTRDGTPVAAVGPRYIDERTGHSSRLATLSGPGKSSSEYKDETTPIRTDFLISSGSLIPTGVIDVVGGMDDDLFIDHVDTEWCMRAVSKGFQAFVVPAATMSHELGGGSRRIWLGRWRHVADHSPTRHYYVVRNSLLLHRRDYAPRAWRRRDRIRLLMLAGYFALFGSDRRAHLQKMFWGWRDARAGLTGPIPTNGARGRVGSAAK